MNDILQNLNRRILADPKLKEKEDCENLYILLHSYANERCTGGVLESQIQETTNQG